MVSFKVCILLLLVSTILVSPGDGWSRRRRRRRRAPIPPPPSCSGNLLTGLHRSHATSSYNPQSQYPHGTAINFACDRGYNQQSGHTTRTCSGSWTGSPLRCANINECKASHGCQYYCVDTDGSYYCSCPARWRLASDSRGCYAPGCSVPAAPANGDLISPQLLYLHGQRASFSCSRGYIMNGSPIISCDAGLWSASPPTCVDVDECSSGQHRCQQTCINTPGLFTCACNPGYKLASDQSSCEATCEREMACKHGGRCIAPNTCSCQTGWTGETCNTAVCSDGCANGRCLSPDMCVCDSGWEGSRCDGPICGRGCLNDGTCVAPSRCACPPGKYTGERCEIRACDTFPPPNNGLTNCAVANSQQTCTVFCQEGYGFAFPPENPQLCGENGKWTYELELDVPPHCSKADELDFFGIVRTEFEYEGECNELTDKDKEEIEQKALASLMARICRNSCEMFQVGVSKVTCGEVTDDNDDGFLFNKRQTSQSFVHVDFSFGIRNVSLFAAAPNKTQVAILLAKNITELMSISVSILSADPMQLSLDDNQKSLKGFPLGISSFPPTKRCRKPGQKVTGMTCLNCPPGSYLNSHDRDCSLCPPGTYQDQEAQDHCLECPYDKYQPRQGQTACVACDNGTFTSHHGSTHISNCTRDCRDKHCLNSLRCDECRCVKEEEVCDGMTHCKDGSDEAGCATCNRTCTSHFLNYSHICNADYAMWLMVNEIHPSPSGTRLSCSMLTLHYLGHRNTLNLTSRDLYLDGMSQACHCPQVSIGKQYFVTVHLEGNNMTLSGDSIVRDWSADLKRELISLGTCRSF